MIIPQGKKGIQYRVMTCKEQFRDCDKDEDEKALNIRKAPTERISFTNH